MLPTVTIRTTPADFQVDEITAYPLSGEGDHLFVQFRKTGLNTPDAVFRIARALGCNPSEAGTAGMKDRHAVTTQWASFLLAHGATPEKELEAATLEGIEVLQMGRHNNKLKTGHLHGNRFRIVLRDVAEEAFDGIEAGLEEARRLGVPNAYGSQRFGREGDNAITALKWLRGESRPPRGKKRQRFLFSALQSAIFNQVLEQRVENGSYATVIAGDLAQKRPSGGMFVVPDEEPTLSEAIARAERGELSATGPMVGAKMRWPEAGVAELERAIVEKVLGDPELLTPFKRLGKGTRRPLRLWIEELEWTRGEEDGSLILTFVLPKGGYATTVLGQVCTPSDPHRPQPTSPAASTITATPSCDEAAQSTTANHEASDEPS